VTSGDWVEIKVLEPDGTVSSDINPLIREVAYIIPPEKLKEIKV